MKQEMIDALEKLMPEDGDSTQFCCGYFTAKKAAIEAMQPYIHADSKGVFTATETWDGEGNIVRVTRETTKLTAEPTEGEIQAVARAFQNTWNDWLQDSGCYPDTFLIERGRLSAKFNNSVFGDSLAKAAIKEFMRLRHE